jgi:hypothetical protein
VKAKMLEVTRKLAGAEALGRWTQFACALLVLYWYKSKKYKY